MIVATVRELKNNENRVGLTPDNVRAYCRNGHKVIVERDAGRGSGFTNEDYEAAGAQIIADGGDVWSGCDLMVKVKEPLPGEYKYLRHDLILFTFLHLAANESLLHALLRAGTASVAYETVRGETGGLPLLRPMSEIAGRLSIVSGSYYLQKHTNGSGTLLASMPGIHRPKVAILGAGTAGAAAMRLAHGVGADCKVLDINLDRLAELDGEYGGKITTVYSTPENVQAALEEADLVVGTVLIPGARAPKIVKREYLKQMKSGSVIVDVAIDQGGCTEVSRPTSYDDPIYNVDGVNLYCVSNMPGSVPHTSTLALTNATLSYGLAIADLGLDGAIKKLPGLRHGLSTFSGDVVLDSLADTFDLDHREPLFDMNVSTPRV